MAAKERVCDLAISIYVSNSAFLEPRPQLFLGLTEHSGVWNWLERLKGPKDLSTKP